MIISFLVSWFPITRLSSSLFGHGSIVGFKVWSWETETHFLIVEGAGLYLYLLVLDVFVLGLVFRITHSAHIPLSLLSELDLGLLQGLRWSSF